MLMNIVVLRSRGFQGKRDDYTLQMNTSYSERFLGHITNRSGYCSSCGGRCVKCRQGYDLDFYDSVVQVVDFPSVLPAVLDDPGEYLPVSVSNHDILVAISVHEEILMSFIERFEGARGVVVPIEAPGWISPYARAMISSLCESRGVEVSFPKPFCSFEPEEGVLGDFRRQFKIGKPEVQYTVKDGYITGTSVQSSAPCGATYFVARNMAGRRVDSGLVNIIDSLLSAYPCTASTEVDREYGDSLIHRAVQLQRDMLKGLELDATAGSGR
jgi:hypothetical protein